MKKLNKRERNTLAEIGQNICTLLAQQTNKQTQNNDQDFSFFTPKEEEDRITKVSYSDYYPLFISSFYVLSIFSNFPDLVTFHN